MIFLRVIIIIPPLSNTSCLNIGDNPFEMGEASFAPNISDHFASTHGLPAEEVKISSTSNSTCFVHDIGSYTCTGSNYNGMLGREPVCFYW